MKYHLSESSRFLTTLLDSGKAPQILLTGHPGTGKTEYSKFYAERIGAKYIYALMHSWVTSEELFNALDVASIATGNVRNKHDAFVPGVLRLAAEASHRGKVVLCLDEIDKVPAKVENALLDFLQTGRVPMPNHSQVQARQENLIVFMTSNGTRQISPAILRRVYRFEMQFLPANVEADIIRHATGADAGLCKNVVRLASLLRADENASKPSLQEMKLLVECLLQSRSVAEVRLAVEGTLVKDSTDIEVLNKSGNWAAFLYGLAQQSTAKAG